MVGPWNEGFSLVIIDLGSSIYDVIHVYLHTLGLFRQKFIGLINYGIQDLVFNQFP